MSIQIYSTLSRVKEPFPKLPGDSVSMYVCGPTVYKPSHIGHMVGPVIFDTIKRFLEYRGYRVTWVVNITDVDDKLIARAKESNTTVTALAQQMTTEYMECLKALHVTGIDHFPRATEYIPQMQDMILRLIDRGFAYEAAGDVYFDVSKDHDYGKLCNRDPEQLEAGRRIEVSDRKRNPGDFALWKAAKADEPLEVQFDSPWGKGRPGWHIECSAMATALLGNTIDIHGGGLDLQFPHHENELAQSESATNQPFARIWMHNGLLKLSSGKMAGSLGNVLNVADALKHVSGDVLRFFILSTHYRSPIDLGDWNPMGSQPLPSGIEAAKRAYETFYRFADRVERILSIPFGDLEAPCITHTHRQFARPEFAEIYERFCHAMDDDFNTGAAIGLLFELVNRLNKLADSAKLDDGHAMLEQSRLAEFREGASLMREFSQILGITLKRHDRPRTDHDHLASELLNMLIDIRNHLRQLAKSAPKDHPVTKSLYEHADQIRKRLHHLGVTIEDRNTGTTWRLEK